MITMSVPASALLFDIGRYVFLFSDDQRRSNCHHIFKYVLPEHHKYLDVPVLGILVVFHNGIRAPEDGRGVDSGQLRYLAEGYVVAVGYDGSAAAVILAGGCARYQCGQIEVVVTPDYSEGISG
jgi:hypothetical protein